MRLVEFVRTQRILNSPSRGLGDTVAKVTKMVGIKPCGGCQKRQEKLNKLLPYKRDRAE